MRRQREHKAKIYGYTEYHRAKRLTNLFYFLFSVWLTFFIFALRHLAVYGCFIHNSYGERKRQRQRHVDYDYFDTVKL